ncbi:MAG: diaminopimelate epimerase [Ignavibacteria bacterium]|nr:diaminopimelate epimerase [Ignavibacteria bacterium]
MIKFRKYSGAGNTFLMINNLDNKVEDRRKTVIKLMGENKGFDGVIFVEHSSIADYHMNYFNRDGTGDALCGNGLRCTARYINDEKISDSKIILLEAVNNIFDCEFCYDGEIKTGFPPPVKMKFNFKLKVQFEEWWQLLNASYVDVGSPHIVVFLDDIEKPVVKELSKIPIDVWGRNIRMHRDLMPEGANVNFVKVISNDGEIAIRSFERGVEAETKACGTGAISSAIVALATKGMKEPVKVMTISGEYLTAGIQMEGNRIKKLTLKGNAVEI